MSILQRNQRNFEAWVKYYKRQNPDFEITKQQEYKLTPRQVQKRAAMGFNDFPLTIF